MGNGFYIKYLTDERYIISCDYLILFLCDYADQKIRLFIMNDKSGTSSKTAASHYST